MTSSKALRLLSILAIAAAGLGGVPQGAAAAKGSALKGDCPKGYEVKAGLNVDFPHEGQKRAFVVYPAEGVSGPAPLFVSMSGTVESANDNLTVARSGATSLLAKQGFTVIGPVRGCAAQDPNLKAGACNGPGKDGWNWAPWNEGRAASAEGDRWKNDVGPDERFFEAMVRCAATKWPIDAKRLYIGGISSGGTMTNRAMLFASKFWSGGLPISGEWYVTKDDGAPLSFEAARAAVNDAPTKIHQGRVGPLPLPKKLDPLVIITVWGGDKDLWSCPPLCSDYRPTTQAASNYFAAQPNVVHVSCSATHGHSWPQVNTQAFNLWALKTLASHPKGTNPKAFKLTTPPEGYKCKLGAFTDHYPQPASPG